MNQSLIQTQAQLDQFIQMLQSQITLSQLATMIDGVVKHPQIKADLGRAVGQKGDKTIRQSDARRLAACLLQFENEHVMAAHYKSKGGVLNYNPVTLCYDHRHGEDTLSIAVPSTLSHETLDFMDVIAQMDCDFDPLVGERLTWGEVVARNVAPENLASDYRFDPAKRGACIIVGDRVAISPMEVKNALNSAGSVLVDEFPEDAHQLRFTLTPGAENRAALIDWLLSELEMPSEYEREARKALVGSDVFDFKWVTVRCYIDLSKGIATYDSPNAVRHMVLFNT